MSDGIIALIIMIVAINVASRILRALSSGKAKQVPKSTGAKVKTSSIPQQDKLERILGRIAVYGEPVFEPPPEGPGGPSTGIEPHEVLAHEGGETAGDFAKWSEDRFEESSDEISYEEEFPAGPAYTEETAGGLTGDLRADEKSLLRRKKAVEDAIKRPARRMAGECSLEDSIRETVGDVPSLRRAVIMSLILGPCRAKRRRF